MSSSALGVVRAPADSPVSTQIEQQKTQRDEYQRFTVSKMVGPLERVLRDLYSAAVLTAKAKGTKDVTGIFRKIVVRVPNWTDDEVAREFPEDTANIDTCIRCAVRAHATVMALTRNRGCKQVIKVPNAQAFFRKILVEVAMDHEPEMFGTTKISQRNKLRLWIEDCVVRHLIALVPISLFAAEDDDDEGEDFGSKPSGEAAVAAAEQSCPVEPAAPASAATPAENAATAALASPATTAGDVPSAAPAEDVPSADTAAPAAVAGVPDKEEEVADGPLKAADEAAGEPVPQGDADGGATETLGSPDFVLVEPSSPATYKKPAVEDIPGAAEAEPPVDQSQAQAQDREEDQLV